MIYVGGGDTYKMMCVWREKGFDKLLAERYAEGRIVFCGSSAGGCCWFDYGYSDSAPAPYKGNYTCGLVEGLGLIGGVFCPHSGGRGAEFEERMKTYKRDGYALDDNTAVVFVNGEATTYICCDYGFVPTISTYTASASGLVKENVEDVIVLK